MNFGISIILKKIQLKMSLNFLSQLSLQVQKQFDRLLVAALTYTPDFKSRIYNRNYCG